MKAWILILICLILVIFCAFIYFTYFSSSAIQLQNKEAIQAAINWGGLDKLPTELQNLKVGIKGSMFTRQFIIQFDSNETDIQQWIRNSKRLRNNIPKLKGRTKEYEIYPGENGAMGGKVEIEGNKVLIDMSWS